MNPQYNEDTMSHDFCLVSVPNLIDNASLQAVFEPACLPGNDFSNFLTIRGALKNLGKINTLSMAKNAT